MKKSSAVHLVLLASAAVTIEGCGRKECVDEHNIVVDPGYCKSSSSSSGAHGYRLYNGGLFGNAPVGSSVSESGTARGIFGGPGEGAGGGAGE